MSEGKNDVWFEPKRYGYGAGMPVSWQGWVLIIGYVLLIVLGVLFASWEEDVWLTVFLILIVPVTAVLLNISALKTRGGWRWRWGDDD